MRISSITRALAGLVAATLLAAGAAVARAPSPVERPKYPPLPHERQAPAAERNLRTFDVLDFEVFSGQQWDRLQESHAEDIVVTWPDGRETRGIGVHIEELTRCACMPVRDFDGHDRALGKREDGSRVALLGQSRLHEADRSDAVTADRA